MAKRVFLLSEAYACAVALMIQAAIVKFLHKVNECFGVGVTSEPWMA